MCLTNDLEKAVYVESRVALQWRHNEPDWVSNHQPHDCLLNSGANQRKHQSSASLAFVRGIHLWPLNSPHKGPVTRKLFPFDDVTWHVGNQPGWASLWPCSRSRSIHTNKNRLFLNDSICAKFSLEPFIQTELYAPQSLVSVCSSSVIIFAIKTYLP